MARREAGGNICRNQADATLPAQVRVLEGFPFSTPDRMMRSGHESNLWM